MSKIIGGSAFGRGDALIDARRAVLLSDVHVVIVGAARNTGVETVIGLQLGGRINHSNDQHEALYLMDADGAAGIISELLGLAGRADPNFLALLLARIENLPKEQP